MTEQKEYYGPEDWQTQPMTDDVILGAMVIRQKLDEAMTALRNIRGMIAGIPYYAEVTTALLVRSNVLEEIDEQCAIILEGADERNSNLS